MKVIRVQYTVQPDFVATNKQNIEAVMSELRAFNAVGIKYASYLLDDGKTFMHLVHYNSQNDDDLPGSLESFQRFQAELKPHLEIPPQAETFELVQSSFAVF